MCGRLSAWTLAATAAVARAHNGVVHEPNTSSAVLVLYCQVPAAMTGMTTPLFNFTVGTVTAVAVAVVATMVVRATAALERDMMMGAVG